MAPLHPRTGNILQSCLSFNFGLLASYRKTFRQADCCGRLQTIRQFRRSDFRRSTQACFPLFIHSGINYPPAAGWSPFLSRKELRFASFPFLSFGILAFYKNAIRRIRLQIGFANLLLQPLTSNLLPFFYAPSRESVQDSCRPVKPCRASHRLENGVAIFADSEQNSRPLPFLSRTGNVLYTFHLQSFCGL